MKTFSIKELATLSGVTVRTLHLYDKLQLLVPATRTSAGYRLYGEKELLRLQQILFYRKLDVPLKKIGDILDDPGFDLLEALKHHKSDLDARQKQISIMVKTINKTISKLKGTKIMTNYKELYEGFAPENATALHEEAVKAYGAKAVTVSENYLGKLTKPKITQLREEQQNILLHLTALMDEAPESKVVQAQIDRHYKNVRQFWGTASTIDKQADAYKGLGELFVSDDRYTMVDGKPQRVFACFMRDAMSYYAKTTLK